MVLCLPPSLNWAARSQNIAISVSDSNNAYSSETQFTEVKAAADYLFDPATGNRVTIELTPVQCRFFKLVIKISLAIIFNGDSCLNIATIFLTCG